jgi:hypothetical protein
MPADTTVTAIPLQHWPGVLDMVQAIVNSPRGAHHLLHAKQLTCETKKKDTGIQHAPGVQNIPVRLQQA